MAGGLNLYGYAGGDPINFSDPFGLFRLEGAAAQQYVRELQASTASESSGGPIDVDDPSSCFVAATAENMRATSEGVQEVFGITGTAAMRGLNFVAGLSAAGLAGHGLQTSGTGRLIAQWSLGRSAGASAVGTTFGYAKVHGIRVGATSAGVALSGTALGVGVATNFLAGASVSAAFQAGAVMGSAMVGVPRCARGSASARR